MKTSSKDAREDTGSRADARGSGWVLTSMIALSVVGLAQLKNTEMQTALGAGVGAAMGGAIGRTIGSIASGAIVGAIVGAAAVAVIRRSDPAPSEDEAQSDQ
ncbi:MAG TPA: hypothetical protein VMO47_05090 [Rhodothermales bacterium]|nr:hypothetical protein [Rhodothermales bacterium]